ncbi:Ig-like domain-containing protein [Mycetocola spongiae]|uniref:Ig-like domain-containing protein n=1 Tax=Mycetocola spongiae TaxID=2859226 RepID=UPI001CF0F334|nr:Ig-like domain-containing protein [Mycetocola spongiae]UCR90329.1 hypothetical protein KXZ72_06685 [Mycetocola spongiae]
MTVNQTVGTGGRTTIDGYSDVVSIEALISLPVGHTLLAGGVTTLTLDPSLKLANFGTLPSGAKSQVWDEPTGTLTVTWDTLLSGGFYGVNLNAKASALAVASSSFTATAVTVGTAENGSGATGPVDTRTTSLPLKAKEGVFAEGTMPVSAGDWTIAGISRTLFPGATDQVYPRLTQVVDGARSFNNLETAVHWQSVGIEGDELLPRSWMRRHMVAAMGGVTAIGETTRNDDEENRYSVGSQGGPLVAAGLSNLTFVVPADAKPGTYSVTRTLEDTRADGTVVVVATSVLRITVSEPTESRVTFNGSRIPAETAIGSSFEWGGFIGVPAPPAALKDLQVTLPIPEGTTPKAFAASLYVSVAPKSVEFTTADPAASEGWKPLELSNGVSGEITQANPEKITGIRFVMNDITSTASPEYSYFSLTLQPNAPQAGDTISMKASSITYIDPVAGESSLTAAANWGGSTTIIPAKDAKMEIALQDTGFSADPSFDQTLANGNSFRSRLFLGSTGTKPIAKPYTFFVVPKGMTAATQLVETCQPVTWPYAYGGCIYGTPVLFPTPELEDGSITLSDGSTLYYFQDTNSELNNGGRLQVTQMHVAPTFTLNHVLAGEHQVLIGAGSAASDDFTISSSRSSHAAYGKKSLSEDASYGSFSGISGEIRDALSGVGINTEGLAMMGERGFTASQTTTVGSSITVTGEDGKPVPPGNGKVAVAKPGGTVGYQVDVSNTGSVAYKNFQFIDVLPYVGDTYTIEENTPRGSQFPTTLSGNVRVAVNGKVSSGATLEYSTSEKPDRFDQTGADVVGDARWLPYTGAVNGAKALRVTLANGVEFLPGDKITLSFDATLPANAPRDGELANNSIPYRFATPSGEWIASEAPLVSLKSTAPSGDVELSGLAYLDLNGNGKLDDGEPGVNGAGISLQLYKKGTDNKFAAEGSPVTPNMNNGIDGIFPFVALEEGIYKIKPLSSNANISFHADALDGEGFLKYNWLANDPINNNSSGGSVDTEPYNGKSEFAVGTAAGVASEWIRDLRLPVEAVTNVSGTVELVSANGTPMTPNSAMGPYLDDYTVTLKGEGVDKSVKTNSSGVFSFEDLDRVVPGKYTLSFASGSKAGVLVESDLNNDQVFANGEYTLNNLQPGIGASGIRVYYTDDKLPVSQTPVLTGAIDVGGVPFNPTGASLKATDAETLIATQSWKLIKNDETAGSGTIAGGDGSFVMPRGLADGSYTLEATATDLVGNVSAPAPLVSFNVDKSAPNLASTSTEQTFVKDSPAAPATAAGWITLYGVTATDAGAGLPANGGITVDSSKVKTTPGSYEVVFTAVDSVGNTTAAKDALKVTYTVAYAGDPVLVLKNNAATFEMGDAEPSTNADWTKLFGDLTVSFGHSSVSEKTRVINSDQVDFSTPGTYPVTFTVTDSLGAVGSTTGQITVRDTTAPVISSAEKTVVYKKGDTQLDPTDSQAWIDLFGVRATDTGGTGLKSLTADASKVTYTAAGNYGVVFTATDEAGNTSNLTLSYKVEFAGDPKINIVSTQKSWEMGGTQPTTDKEWAELFGVTAEVAAGTTLKSITADSSAVEFTTWNPAPGYTVTFTATDNLGNKATATVQLLVVDTKKPKASAKVDTLAQAMTQPETAWTTQQWLDAFQVSATDTAGSGIDADTWAVSQTVDYTTAGNYPVSFTVKDKAGNDSNTVTVTVVVQAPPTSSAQEEKRIPQERGVKLDPLSVSTTTGKLEALSEASLGQTTQGGSLKLVDGKVVYTPAQGYSGPESFSITVTDTLGQTGTVGYNFIVVAAPVVAEGATFDYTVPMDGDLEINDLTGPASITGEQLTVTAVKQPEGFVGELSIDKDKEGVVFATDRSNWAGKNTATVTISDDLGQEVEITATFTVAAPTFASDIVSGFSGDTEVTLTAGGLVPGAEYAVELHSSPLPLGVFTAAADGTGKLTVQVPAQAETGKHEIVLLNGARELRGNIAFEVLAVNTGDGSGGNVPGENGSGPLGGLSLTGAQGVTVLTLLAGLLLLAGIGASFLAKRRRTSREQENV